MTLVFSELKHADEAGVNGDCVNDISVPPKQL